MKLATFTTDTIPEVGILTAQGLIPLSRALPRVAPDMVALITAWDDARGEIERAGADLSAVIPLDQARILAPIARPGKMLAIGLNYADHVAESRMETPVNQVWFCKQPSAVNGPFDPIMIPRVSDRIDYEAELVAVIGRRGKHISKATAPDHLFGYCCGNDVSVRDWQLQTPQWMLGKSFDTHAPFGPWIVTADEVGDPHALAISCLVNGETRQSSNTRHLIFNIFDQVEHLSKAMTLEPGDVIFTGTPGGVGAVMKPPRFLAAGDTVRVEIDRLGAIEAVMADE
ncbi:MAG: fumarylacetoacetate hydrolase family protein [Bradyrhizobium sp.]|nr:fumarylacetoacetate hydrolase family protein [Bradyrhizobium sp.]